MSNTIEHKIPTEIVNLVNTQAPNHKILGVVGTGITEYYPSIDKDGNQMSCADYTFEELLAAKVCRQRLTVRLRVEGNAVSAEEFIKQLTGYDSMAISDDYVDVYVPLMDTK